MRSTALNFCSHPRLAELNCGCSRQVCLVSFVILCSFFLLASPLAANPPFKDIPDNHWAEKSVDRMVQMGLTSGYQDGTFKGLKSVTRFELALYLSNFAHYVDKRIFEQVQPISDRDRTLLSTQLHVKELQESLDEMKKQVQQLQAELATLKKKQ